MINLYRRLNLGWKRLLWVLGILFSLIGPGIFDSTLFTDIFNPNVYLNSWSIEETIIVVYLSLVGWWVAIFIILWIINMIPSHHKFSLSSVKLGNKQPANPYRKHSNLKIHSRVPAARKNSDKVAKESDKSSGPLKGSIKQDNKIEPQNIHPGKKPVGESGNINQLLKEISQLHEEIKELKQEYSELKQEDKAIKEEVKQIKDQLIKAELKEREDKMHLDSTSKQLKPDNVEELEIKIKPLSAVASKEG